MSTETDGYLVKLESFANTHYCKDFGKKHPSWELTWNGLEQLLIRFNPEALLGKLEPPIKINSDGTLVLYKMSFRLAGSNESAKSSGNRIIFVCDNKEKIIRILLVYNKNHVKGDRETDWWMKLIYTEYQELP